MTTYTRTTHIDQHIGMHDGTGLRMYEVRKIVTEHALPTCATEDDAGEVMRIEAFVDDLHASRVAMASLNAAERAVAQAWLDEQDVDAADEARWIDRAIAHAKS